MKNLNLFLLMLLAFKSYSQTEPSRSDALAVLKKYKYDLYVSKNTGVAVNQLKFEKRENLYSGEAAMYKYKTRAAKQYYWPDDRLVYIFKIVTPKDKDGIQTKYHFEVVYSRSKCLTDGYGCILMNTWEMESANKYGPFFIGAKSVDNGQIVELIKDRFKNEKETVLEELKNISVGDWVKIDSIIPTSQLYDIYKEEVISKTKRKNAYIIVADRATFEMRDPKIRQLLNRSHKVDVTYELIDNAWKITKMFAIASGHDENWDKYEVNDMYMTYKEGAFEDIYTARTRVDFPSESCTALLSTASNYYRELKKGDFKSEAFKALYLDEAAYQKDLSLFTYFEAQGYTYQMDSSQFTCKSFDAFPTIQIYFTSMHSKFKGKVMKDWKSKCASDNSIQSKAQSFYSKGKLRQTINLEFELVKGRWKIKGISEQILPDL